MSCDRPQLAEEEEHEIDLINSLDNDGDFMVTDHDDEIDLLDFLDEEFQSSPIPPCFDIKEECPEQSSPVATVKHRIQTILDNIANQLDNGVQLEINPKAFSPFPSDHPGNTIPLLQFPGQTPEDSWQFSVILKIMSLSLEALENNAVVSKRDIYYRDPALFGNQRTVDKNVDLLTAALNVQRSDLNIRAAAKGLIHGHLTFTMADGSQICLSRSMKPLLVQSVTDYISVDASSVDFVLIVEKEASFQSILSSVVWEQTGSRGVLLTAKGYPDLATQHMLKALSNPSPWNRFRQPAVYILTDFDPDGIAIANMYQYGSSRGTVESISVAVPLARRIGLTRAHLVEHSTDTDVHKVIPLTSRDRRRAVGMLHKLSSSSDPARQGDRLDLQVMLMLNYKAELQILDDSSAGLVTLLEGL